MMSHEDGELVKVIDNLKTNYLYISLRSAVMEW